MNLFGIFFSLPAVVQCVLSGSHSDGCLGLGEKKIDFVGVFFGI